MNAITVEMVLRAAEELLAAPQGGGL